MLPTHIFCSNCGVKNQKNAGFCFNCGSQLARPDNADNTFQMQANGAGSDQQVSEVNSATGFLPANTILKQRYRIVHSVGRGGMGAVYMSEDMQLGHRMLVQLF